MLTFTNESVNIVMDGNSLIFGNATPDPTHRIGDQLMLLSPINGAMTYKRIAIGGQTFKTMTGIGGGSMADVHAAFEAGKENLLFILEGVNSANAGMSGATIIQDCKNYITAAKAVHPEWRVYIIIAPPFQEDANPAVKNAAVDEYNAYVRRNYKRLGAEGFVETRPTGGPLAYTKYNYSETTFTKSGHYQDGIHLNGAGNAIVAQYIATKLMAIPNEAPPLRIGGGGIMLGGF